jgi:hypothetical protein
VRQGCDGDDIVAVSVRTSAVQGTRARSDSGRSVPTDNRRWAVPPWSQTLPPVDREPDASTSVERSSPPVSVSVAHWETNSMTVSPVRVALCAIPDNSTLASSHSGFGQSGLSA